MIIVKVIHGGQHVHVGVGGRWSSSASAPHSGPQHFGLFREQSHFSRRFIEDLLWSGAAVWCSGKKKLSKRIVAYRSAAIRLELVQFALHEQVDGLDAGESLSANC